MSLSTIPASGLTAEASTSRPSMDYFDHSDERSP